MLKIPQKNDIWAAHHMLSQIPNSEFSQNFQVILSFRQKRIKTNIMHSGGLENHENSEFRIRTSEFIKVYYEQLSYL